MPRLLPFSSNACLTEWNSTECRAGKFVCDIDGEHVMMRKDETYETAIESQQEESNQAKVINQ